MISILSYGSIVPDEMRSYGTSILERGNTLVTITINIHYEILWVSHLGNPPTGLCLPERLSIVQILLAFQAHHNSR